MESIGVVNGANLSSSRTGGWKYTTYLIEPRFFIPWLRLQLEALSVTFKQSKVTSWDSIMDDYTVIVNCTGIGSRMLENDEKVSAVGGQILVARHSGLNYWIRDKSSPHRISYIYPQRNTVVLGGTSSKELRKDEEKLKTEILEGCLLLDPAVSSYTLIGLNGHYRPYRSEFRIETDLSRLNSAGRAILIHNYGHGGEGYCFAPGTATHVLKLTNKLLGRKDSECNLTPLVILKRPMKTKL